MLEEKLEQDLKAALLSGERLKVTTLRGLKNALLYAKVARGKQGTSLPDDEVVSILGKESKKRQESADLYEQGGNHDKAQAELEEKSIIDAYLPPQLSNEELAKIVEQTINELGNDVAMGQAIAAVKQKTAGTADGTTIAKLVKERLSSK
jgi:uncharacterized protein YqeY